MSDNREPLLRVGLMSDRALPTVKLTLSGRYQASNSEVLQSGEYIASNDGGSVRLVGSASINAPSLALTPVDFDASRATIHGITIGVDFHWERSESQTFQGSVVLSPQSDGLLVINELPLEAYLVSVISSEMSASAPRELLRAHAIVSRSWLLAQMRSRDKPVGDMSRDKGSAADQSPETEIIRW
ncbi:MAG TPA: SpoIID/LytB domain-containing protein, partial [Blastocatellia bacterium]|nr:SpoIID/LytB domain-containing protein [Blastocatellia bacterium]